MLCGRLPFDGKNASGYIRKHVLEGDGVVTHQLLDAARTLFSADPSLENHQLLAEALLRAGLTAQGAPDDASSLLDRWAEEAPEDLAARWELVLRLTATKRPNPAALQRLGAFVRRSIAERNTGLASWIGARAERVGAPSHWLSPISTSS